MDGVGAAADGRTDGLAVSAARTDVEVAGGRLATFAMGAQRAGAPLVLAIHGITSSSASWPPTARALGDRATLIAVDLRGRAASNALPAPFGIDVDVRDMLAVLDHFGLGRAVIAGHSLGAYVAARLAAQHPDRVAGLVLVDGGLSTPLPDGVDRQALLEDFLGPTLARLAMTFPDVAAYRDWWAQHPAIAAGGVARDDLEAYAAHDLVGDPPALRSSVNPEVVRADGLGVLELPDAHAIAVPAVLLCAARGMIDNPEPVQPPALAHAWAAADPARRRVVQVPDVNHYTIALGAAGASAIAEEIARAV
ncbi:MAG: alpha/beta fold hydrolase [Solirubrobacteraceae bacterium]